MLGFILTLFCIQIAIQLIVGDTFRDTQTYTFKHRLRKTILLTAILLAYTLYQSLDEGTLLLSHSSNPYFILGVRRTATKKEITTQARRLAKLNHPDRNLSPDAAVRFNQIRDAAKLLLNDNWRLGYDRFGDTLKQEYLENAMTYPNVLMMIFIWDALKHTVTSLLFHTIILHKEIKEGNFNGLVTYIVTVAGLQSAILMLRFLPLRSDAETIQTILDEGYQLSLIESLPFVRNLTMFQRTRFLASIGPLMLTMFRLIQPFWQMLLDEYEAMRAGEQWVPVDYTGLSMSKLLEGMVDTNHKLITYCQVRLARYTSTKKDDTEEVWKQIKERLENPEFWTRLRRVLQDNEDNVEMTKWLQSLQEDLQQGDYDKMWEILNVERAQKPRKGFLPFRSNFIFPILLVAGINYFIAQRK